MNIAEETLETLEAQRTSIENEMIYLRTGIAGIRADILDAKAKVATRGEYSDPDWYRRANYALTTKGHRHQILQQQLSAVNKKIKALSHAAADAKSWKTRFVEVSRRLLTEEMYERIMSEAKGETP